MEFMFVMYTFLLNNPLVGEPEIQKLGKSGRKVAEF